MTLTATQHPGLERMLRGIAAIPAERNTSLSVRLLNGALAIAIGALILALVAAGLVETPTNDLTAGGLFLWAAILFSVMVFAKAGSELILCAKQAIIATIGREHEHSANARHA